MMAVKTQIAENLSRVRERIAAACGRADRDPASVRLVAVTKYAELEWVCALVEQGVTELGESRPQQLVERASEFGPTVDWHLIGHLQRNKARRALPLVSLIHSVDTFRLLSTLDRLAVELDLQPRVLLEVNASGESQKHGFLPDELASGWNQCLKCERVQVVGLMGMAARVGDVEEARPAFRQLRELLDRLRLLSPVMQLPELSMGMSGDFEIAIEEGATIIRVGSGLYEGLSR
ncbi:MAG: YggS family pyridoxal phosphate-dependent enzyme [Planctomycetaceae bacterium]|nr:YggS family pyridoxal phosphate-dependent enzyme [Planctomycetaceae bacterium]MBT6486030.1 YggS family pyridoxal phosphate-dependent enzyme [Planctomycetaceae bacterium]MBT6496171.1 YggS family pyridoxal phosphate-dependent enzyme [Planctomycetaceae bacterium]